MDSVPPNVAADWAKCNSKRNELFSLQSVATTAELFYSSSFNFSLCSLCSLLVCRFLCSASDTPFCTRRSVCITYKHCVWTKTHVHFYLVWLSISKQCLLDSMRSLHSVLIKWPRHSHFHFSHFGSYKLCVKLNKLVGDSLFVIRLSISSLFTVIAYAQLNIYCQKTLK